MKEFDLNSCGVFDSKNIMPQLKESDSRTIELFEIEYVISSNGVSHINGKSCKLSPGMVLIRKPGDVSNSKLHFKCYYLKMHVAAQSKYCEFLKNCPSFFTNVNSAAYFEIFQSLVNNVTQYGLKSDCELITIDLLRLLYNLKKDAIYNIDTNRNDKLSSTVSAIIHYLDENFQNKIKLGDLTDVFGYSSFYIQKRFKELVGVSPNEYVLAKRVTLAKQELINTNDKMIDIAYRCGFSSQSYFCCAFKKMVGVLPMEYKKSFAFNY